MAESYLDRLEAERLEKAGGGAGGISNSNANPALPSPALGGSTNSFNTFPSVPVTPAVKLHDIITTPQANFNSFGSGGGSTSQPVPVGSTTNSYPGITPAQPLSTLQPQLARQPSIPLQPGLGRAPGVLPVAHPAAMPSAANGAPALSVPTYQPLGVSGGHGALPSAGHPAVQATPPPVRMTMTQQYELLKQKKVKLTEKLCRFFKVLEQRIEKQPMDAAQMTEGKQKIRQGCQLLCQFKLDVPQFLIQMQTILRSAIPPGLQPTLTKAMAEYKDTVVKIYKIKQHALKLQTDANAAKQPLTSPAPVARPYATGVGAAGVGPQPTAMYSPNMGLVKPSTAGLDAAQAQRDAALRLLAAKAALPSVAIHTWQEAALRHLPNRPHTVFPLPSDAIMQQSMFLNAAPLNQILQQNVATILADSGQGHYNPRVRNRVADDVHEAVSSGVREWLKSMLADISQLCNFRINTEQEYADEELSFPRKQIEAFNNLDKKMVEREDRARTLRLERSGTNEAKNMLIKQREKAEADKEKLTANKTLQSMFGFGNNRKKKRTANQFQLPPSANAPKTWNKGASVIIYVKREPGEEDGPNKRQRFQPLPGRIKSRISTDDLVCFLESKPRLAKSHGLFRYLAKRGAENYKA